ncbi:hypothetical protein Hanom_Chr10g00958111 [Helianthus anomalus]
MRRGHHKFRRPKRSTQLKAALPRCILSPTRKQMVSINNNPKLNNKMNLVANYSLYLVLLCREPIFECPPGVSIMRGSFETIYPELCLDADVITAWAVVLNYEERLRVPGTPARLFCDAGILVRHLHT